MLHALNPNGEFMVATGIRAIEQHTLVQTETESNLLKGANLDIPGTPLSGYDIILIHTGNRSHM